MNQSIKPKECPCDCHFVDHLDICDSCEHLHTTPPSSSLEGWEKRFDIYLEDEDNYHECFNIECEGCYGPINKDKLKQFISEVIKESQQAERGRILNELYTDLDFHHIFKTGYKAGDYDDGGHTAIDKVKKEIIKLLTALDLSNKI